MNLPNILTLCRILVTPLFIILLFYDHPYAKSWALFIFVVAMLTDIFDGYYARKHNLVTDYGRFLDPLADKVMVLSALISFAVMDVIPYWMGSLKIFRDVFVTGLRMAMSSKNKTFSVYAYYLSIISASIVFLLIISSLFIKNSDQISMYKQTQIIEIQEKIDQYDKEIYKQQELMYQDNIAQDNINEKIRNHWC